MLRTCRRLDLLLTQWCETHSCVSFFLVSTPQLDGECLTTITHLLKKSSVKLLFSIPHNQTCALIISVWKKRSRFWFGFRNRNLETGQDCDFDPFSHSETRTRERVTFTHVTSWWCVATLSKQRSNSPAALFCRPWMSR